MSTYSSPFDPSVPSTAPLGDNLMTLPSGFFFLIHPLFEFGGMSSILPFQLYERLQSDVFPINTVPHLSAFVRSENGHVIKSAQACFETSWTKWSLDDSLSIEILIIPEHPVRKLCGSVLLVFKR